MQLSAATNAFQVPGESRHLLPADCDQEIEETAYGVKKRFDFISTIIAQLSCKRVLDVGCGNGALLTIPLARRFPDVKFLAIDPDITSIESASSRNDLPNLIFMLPEQLDPEQRFDVVIASEVLEHVADPVDFLGLLRFKLTQQGKLILTVPNGYGPFEIDCLIFSLLVLSGLVKRLKALRGLIQRQPSPCPPQEVDTLAVSPHVNFFRYRQLRRLLAGCGLSVTQYQPKTLCCGPIWDKLIRGPLMIAWNACISNWLPAACSSGWMLVAEDAAPCGQPIFQRSAVDRLRAYLHRKRAMAS